MKTTLKLLITIVLLLTINSIHAQSHDMSPGSTCRLIKTAVNSESRICPVCAAEDKKEKAAKLAEDKRRIQVIWDKAAADKIAKDKAWKDKQLADAKNAHSGEVYINGNTNATNSIKATKGTTKIISKKGNSKSKLFPAKKHDLEWLKTSFILNEVGDTIINSTKWVACKWNRVMAKEDIPTDVIIVIYQSQEKYNSETYNSLTKERFALINSKGEELLEEKRISYLNYVGNDFFVYAFVNENDNILRDFNNNDEDYIQDDGCGRTVVLFDYKLNKKYYFDESYCIRSKFQPILEDGVLLEFSLGRYFKDKYIVNSNREYVKINN